MAQGKPLTEQQIKYFFDLYDDPGNDYTVEQAAKLAGFCERSGNSLLADRRRREAGGQEDGVPENTAADSGKNPKKAGRKPCPDLDAAFEKHAVPMLAKRPKTMAVTIIRILKEKLGEDEDWAKRKARSIQRRVKKWKRANARKPKAFLPQHYEPGYEMQLDFTHADGLGVTIQGKPFKHMLFGAYLPYSGMRYFEVVQGGESFNALRRGTENAFHYFDGAPVRVHTDSLSAASKNTHWQTEKNHTRMVKAFRDHYGVDWHLSNPGRPNEKGGIERIIGNLKDHLADWLAEWLMKMLEERGSADFESVEEYGRLVQKCFEWLNSRTDGKLRLAELNALQKLPESRFEPFVETEATANSYSFVSCKYGNFSVPTECIGEKVVVRNFGHRTDLILDGAVVASHAPAKLGRDGDRYAVKAIHLIDDLKEKHMGLKHLAYLEQLFLNDLHARTFDLAIAKLGDRKGCRLYVNLLSLAVEHGRAAEIDAIMTKCLATGDLPDIGQVREQLQIPVANRSKAAAPAETDAAADSEERSSAAEPNRREHPMFSYSDILADENLRQYLLIGMYFMETARSLNLRGKEGMRQLADAAAVMLLSLMPPPGSDAPAETPPVEPPAAENPTAETPTDEPSASETAAPPGSDAGVGREPPPDSGDSAKKKPEEAEHKAPVTAKKAPTDSHADQYVADSENWLPTGRQVVDACRNLKEQGANYYVGPCPVCGGEDCFSVDVKRNLIYCRKCDPNSKTERGRRAFAKIMQALGFSTKRKITGGKRKKAETASVDANGSGTKDQEKIRKAAGFWNMCGSPEGTRTWNKLWQRGITWRSDDIRHTDKALRGDKSGRHQCMAVRFVNTLTNLTQAVQRTFWDEEEPGLRRMNMGVMSGAAAFIGGKWECSKWTVAEGTEDAATLAQCGVGGAVLASGGTEPMKKLKVPDHVTHVVVAADNDDPGRKAASALRKRLEGTGVKVEVLYPADGCKDWNEMLCKGLENEIRKIMRS